jgi:hypothetical protein
VTLEQLADVFRHVADPTGEADTAGTSALLATARGDVLASNAAAELAEAAATSACGVMRMTAALRSRAPAPSPGHASPRRRFG